MISLFAVADKPDGESKKKAMKYVVVDAFTDCEFKGNPAAVCILEQDRDNEWLQSMAAEFNLNMTCFLTRVASPNSPNTTRFLIQWFTPITEVVLCGHATLAAAHYCFISNLVTGNTIEFSTILSEILIAKKVEPKAQDSLGCENEEPKKAFFIELDFPAIPSKNCDENEITLISEALGGVALVEVKKTALDDYIVVFPSAKAVMDAQPEVEKIQKCPGRGLLVTAIAPPGSRFDFFSRTLFPKLGVYEDPTCGSAHCALAVYWSNKLQKCNFLAYQGSRRSGILKLHFNKESNRVQLQGQAVKVMEGIVIV